MFVYESCMRQSVVRWMSSLKLIVKSEFTTPWGICDLVGLQFNERHAAHRLRLGQTRPIGSVTRAALLLLIPDVETDKTITILQLARECEPAIQRDVVIEETRRLEADGFIVRQSGNRLQKINGWMPLQKRFIAVELKLSRVEEAILQAESNLGFVDESYVALPKDLAARTIAKPARQEQFRKSGLGLLSVAPKSTKVVISPRRKTLENSAVQFYSVEKFWRAYLKGN